MLCIECCFSDTFCVAMDNLRRMLYLFSAALFFYTLVYLCGFVSAFGLIAFLFKCVRVMEIVFVYLSGLV